MPNLLEDLELEELSLVDRPANAEATVSLFKRDNKEDKMSETVNKEDFDKVKADLDQMKKSNEDLRAAVLQAGFEITKDGITKKQEEEHVVYKGEKIAKSDDRYEMAKELAEAQIEKQEQALAKRAESELPNLESEVAVTLLKTADSEEDEKFLEFLRSVDALFGKQFEEHGSSNADGDMKTAAEKMEELVKAYMEEKGLQKRDRAKAYDAVAKTDEGKALVKAIYKGE